MWSARLNQDCVILGTFVNVCTWELLTAPRSGSASVVLLVTSPVASQIVSCRCHLIPGGAGGKEPACDAGDVGSIPGSEGSPGEGNGNPLQYFCLGNPMDRGAWRATVHGVTKSWKQLSNFRFVSKQSFRFYLLTLRCE